MNISGIDFERIDQNTWKSRNGRFLLSLVMTTENAAFPWRIAIDGRERVSRYSTPVVAVKRALDLLAYRKRMHEQAKS